MFQIAKYLFKYGYLVRQIEQFNFSLDQGLPPSSMLECSEELDWLVRNVYEIIEERDNLKKKVLELERKLELASRQE